MDTLLGGPGLEVKQRGQGLAHHLIEAKVAGSLRTKKKLLSLRLTAYF
jgi:hypothetical protein